VLQLQREARLQYEEAVRLAPDCETAQEGLFYALRALGEIADADQHRRKAFELRYIIPCAYRRGRAPVRVLQLVSTNGGNVRLQIFLDERIFQRFKVLREFYKAGTTLPAHQLVINAIGDAELSSPALIDARSVLESTRAPIINAPAEELAAKGETTLLGRLVPTEANPGAPASVCAEGLCAVEGIVIARDHRVASPDKSTKARFCAGKPKSTINFFAQLLFVVKCPTSHFPSPQPVATLGS
jgi:hypothetical protein